MIIVLDAPAIQQHLSCGGFIEVLYQVDAGTLASPAGTHQGYHLPRGRRETHILFVTHMKRAGFH